MVAKVIVNFKLWPLYILPSGRSPRYPLNSAVGCPTTGLNFLEKRKYLVLAANLNTTPRFLSL